MADKSDLVFVLEQGEFKPRAGRSFREGLFGETLEAALQNLIATHPEVLPGRQMDPNSNDPPKFALLGKEVPIGGWSLDLLMVDQRGVLTLVETKLAGNPESRRTVIGQILEYAAHCHDLWGYGYARELATAFWSKTGTTRTAPDREDSVDDELQHRLGLSDDLEGFWAMVESNLRKRQIRLIVAADELRPNVKRIVEYLNEEMENAEVYGLEIHCYGDDQESLILVPRLVGQTQEAVARKQGTVSGRAMTEEEFVAAIPVELRTEAHAFVSALTWAEAQQQPVGRTSKTYYLGEDAGNALYWRVPSTQVRVWAPAEVFEKRREQLQRIGEPWSSRIRLRPPLKDGVRMGMVAEIEVKGATEEEFRRLLDFYAKAL